MDEEAKQQIAAYVAEFHLPRFRELPDLDLRLEQVVRYLEKLVPSPITGSMVSNYVKQKLIPHPDRKCYSREALAYLVFIFYIKNVMSLEDIRLLIGVQQRTYPLEVAYDYFCEEFENLLRYVCGLKDAPDHIGRSYTAEKDLLRTALLSITYKVYLEQYLILIRQKTEAK